MTKFISVLEYLMGRAQVADLTQDQVGNLNTLIPRVNDLLERYGQPVTMSSGFRSASDQARINPKVTHSKHMECAAIDISDKSRDLTNWCLANLPVLAEIGLWMESPESATTWIHCQSLPPASGNRVFKP